MSSGVDSSMRVVVCRVLMAVPVVLNGLNELGSYLGSVIDRLRVLKNTDRRAWS